MQVYSADSIASLIIRDCYEADYLITNLRLQCLLYLLQAYFLGVKNRALFEDRIEAWDFSPVVPSVYKEYMAANNIDIGLIYPFDKERPKISKADKELIRDICLRLLSYDTLSLQNICRESAPYICAYIAGGHCEITKRAIRTHYQAIIQRNSH